MLARQAGGSRRSPSDRRISGEPPNLDNIIQESESQYGDSARADTIQLPRGPDRPRAGRRLRHSGSGTAPFTPGLGVGVPALRLGGPPLRGARHRPETGFWLRALSLSRYQLAPTPAAPHPGPSGPLPALPACPEPLPGARDPTGPQASPNRAGKDPASRVPPRLPAGPREDPRFQPRSPRPCPLAGPLTWPSVLPRDTWGFKEAQWGLKPSAGRRGRAWSPGRTALARSPPGALAGGQAPAGRGGRGAESTEAGNGDFPSVQRCGPPVGLAPRGWGWGTRVSERTQGSTKRRNPGEAGRPAATGPRAVALTRSPASSLQPTKRFPPLRPSPFSPSPSPHRGVAQGFPSADARGEAAGPWREGRRG